MRASPHQSLLVSVHTGLGAGCLGFPRLPPKLKSSSGDNSGRCHNASDVPLQPYLPDGPATAVATVLALGGEGVAVELGWGKGSLVPAGARAAMEITHFNRPVTSVFRTGGGLPLQGP